MKDKYVVERYSWNNGEDDVPVPLEVRTFLTEKEHRDSEAFIEEFNKALGDRKDEFDSAVEAVEGAEAQDAVWDAWLAKMPRYVRRLGKLYAQAELNAKRRQGLG